MDQVPSGLAGERIAAIIFQQFRPLINHQARSGREVASMKRSGSDVCAKRIKPASSAMIGNVFNLLPERQIRIALQIGNLHEDVLNVIAIRANEFPSEAVKRLA